jgi:hypothetical protein
MGIGFMSKPLQYIEQSHLKLGGEKMRKYFLILFLNFLTFISCEKIFKPGKEEPIEFRYNVEVVYTRDVNKIKFPNAPDIASPLVVELYNPFRGGYEDKYDQINIQMEKIAENKFRGVIPQVYIQRSIDLNWKHKAYIFDRKIGGVTGEMKIEGEYGVEIRQYSEGIIQGTQRFFLMGK